VNERWCLVDRHVRMAAQKLLVSIASRVTAEAVQTLLQSLLFKKDLGAKS